MEARITVDDRIDTNNCSRFHLESNPDNTKLQCPKCNQYTSYGVYLDASYGYEIKHYECFNCKGYYCVCFDCEDVNNGTVHLAQLISHHNYDNVQTNGDDYILTNNEISYTKPTYFYDESRFGYITGPDGGFSSVWKCDCSIMEVNDK